MEAKQVYNEALAEYAIFFPHYTLGHVAARLALLRVGIHFTFSLNFAACCEFEEEAESLPITNCIAWTPGAKGVYKTVSLVSFRTTLVSMSLNYRVSTSTPDFRFNLHGKFAFGLT